MLSINIDNTYRLESLTETLLPTQRQASKHKGMIGFISLAARYAKPTFRRLPLPGALSSTG